MLWKKKTVTRKITLNRFGSTNEGYLISKTQKLCSEYGAELVNYKFTFYKCSIKFRCPKDKWNSLHAEFQSLASGLIYNVRCKM